MTNHNLKKLQTTLKPYQSQLINHPLYAQLNALQDIQLFASHHIYAVWDFMSLLKSLQRQMTGVTHPWRPVGDPEIRHLINDIVLGEESDQMPDGSYGSHFEIYLRAIREMGCPEPELLNHLEHLSSEPMSQQLLKWELPEHIQGFCFNTFSTIETAPLYVQAGIFAFGREELIPEMFKEVVRILAHKYPDKLSLYLWYFERHIEVDADSHHPMALRMMEKLCEGKAERWHEATEAIVQAYQARIQLWDGILKALKVPVLMG